MNVYTTPNAYTWKIGDELLSATHLLIAGTTGSGKSVLINDIMLSLITKKTPASASVILIDPKRIELSAYKTLPFAKAYVQEPWQVETVLRRTIDEMEQRYKEIARMGLRLWQGGALYIVIDELADLMISGAASQIKRLLQRLLQLGRAAGIHIIAATQAPGRKIIPAELVLNFTDRVALRCLSGIESRQIIGVNGAELLPIYGEAYYRNPNGLKRVAIPITPENDLQNRIAYWKRCA